LAQKKPTGGGALFLLGEPGRWFRPAGRAANGVVISGGFPGAKAPEAVFVIAHRPLVRFFVNAKFDPDIFIG
jgi:hypothetical protein